MPIQSVCTGCGKMLSVADEYAGKRARCPACGNIYTVPAPLDNSASEHLEPVGAATSNTEAVEPGFGDPAFTGSPDEMFWMRSTDGNVYGPTDRGNLHRWFLEGRVGAGYQIRQGDAGLWEDAALFRPGAPGGLASSGQSSANPYAAQTSSGYPHSPAGTPLYKYPKPDRGIIVLVMGILSYAVCFIFAIVAVVMGRSALNDINAGLANPNDKTLVQIGFWLGVVNLILSFAVLAFALVVIVISIVNQ